MKYQNVSSKTSPDVLRLRRVPRRGIILHESIGVDSLGWLQGASAMAGSPASADFLITRDGIIYQIGRIGYYTFHSGTARWQLLQDTDYTLNRSFVGIEYENHPGRGQKITDYQYIASAALIRRLLTTHLIPVQNVRGHYEVALPRGRKSDPVTLDYAILTRELINPSPEGRALVIPAVLP